MLQNTTICVLNFKRILWMVSQSPKKQREIENIGIKRERKDMKERGQKGEGGVVGGRSLDILW